MTEQIFKNFLDRTKAIIESEHDDNAIVDRREIMQWVRYSLVRNTGTWNGRRIRNAFQIAIAMAEHKARESASKKNKEVDVDIGSEQFEYFANSVLSFDRYLESTIGSTAEERARMERLRGVNVDERKQEARKQKKGIGRKGEAVKTKKVVGRKEEAVKKKKGVGNKEASKKKEKAYLDDSDDSYDSDDSDDHDDSD
jgi:hypothetical protein